MYQSQEVMYRENSINDQYDKSYTKHNSIYYLWKMLISHHLLSYDGHIPPYTVLDS
jgi:hypothetical protein